VAFVNDIWGRIGAIAGVVAILVGVLEAWWFARGPRLLMQVAGTTLIASPDNARIIVLFDQREVPRVTQSIVWIWREGRGTVRGTDVVGDDPVILHVPEGEWILDARVLRQSRSTNNVSIDFDPQETSRASKVPVHFEYLDSRQGFAIELQHTAQTPDCVTISGTVMGIPKGIVSVAQAPTVYMPIGLGIGGVAVTVPTHIVPRNLRIGGTSENWYRPSAIIQTLLALVNR
jgi:hypothetical protein